MCKIKSVQAAGYRSLKGISIDLRPLNIIIGENGAGKSNLLGLFELLRNMANQDLEFYTAKNGGVETLLYRGEQGCAETITIDVEIDGNRYFCALVPTFSGRFVVKEEYTVNCNATELLAKSGENESALKLAFDGPPLLFKGTFSNYFIYHFHDTSNTARIKKTGAIHDNQFLRSQGENLAAFLYAIKETKNYQKIVQTVQRVVPFFQDFVLQPDKYNEEQIRLQWRSRGSDKCFDANSLSDGTLRFICLVTLLMQPQLPAIILLDEPELGLHPYALQLLGGLLKSASALTQIVLCTQSVTLINQFECEDIIVVNQQNGASKFERMVKKDFTIWLGKYQVNEL